MHDIPIFDGNMVQVDSWPTCGQFLAMVEDVAEREKYDEHQMKEFLLSKLSDKPLELIRSNLDEPWSTQKALLKDNFSVKLTVKQKVEIRQNLQQQVTEPIDDFYNRCVHAQYLVSDGDCTIDAFFNREVLLHFLIGLVPFIRNKVLEADCSSAVDFIQEAKRVFSDVKEEPDEEKSVDKYSPTVVKVEPDGYSDVDDEDYNVYDNDYHPMDDEDGDDSDYEPDGGLFPLLPLKIKCDRCPKSFENAKEFASHYSKKHKKSTSSDSKTPKAPRAPRAPKKASALKCDFCPDEFETVEARKEHEKSIHSGMSKTCDKCDEEFPTFKIFIGHMAKEHCETNEEGNTVCCFCFKYNNREVRKVRDHILAKHFNCPNHRCKQCGKQFGELSRLTHHVQTSHEGMKPFQCDKCAKSFKTKVGLQNHCAVFHDDDGQSIWKCKHEGCDRTFTNKVHLQTHHSVGHKTEITSWVCDVCGKSFTRKDSLRCHTLTVHSTLEEHEKIRYKCQDPNCSYSSLIKKDADVHYKRTHLKIKNFSCTYCPKSFFKRHGLDEHVNGVHLNKKPLHCDKCTFQTAYSSTLNDHKKTAHGNQRYDCPYCNHSAKFKGNLDKHVNNVHKNIVAETGVMYPTKPVPHYS